MKKWYIVQAHSNLEKQAVEAIQNRADEAGLKDAFEEIILPSQEVIQIRRGKKIKADKKLFPGYILIKADMDERVAELIKKTPKITGFPGVRQGQTIPKPISKDEIDRIMNYINQEATESQNKIAFVIGENVRVSDGPFASFSGYVDEVDQDRTRLKVLVSIFGRATPVSLNFNQVEKVSS